MAGKNGKERRSAVVANGAYLVVSPAGEIYFAADETKQWLKQFFSNGQPEGFVPDRVRRWLAQASHRGRRRALSAKRKDACLLVTTLQPRVAGAIVLLMELHAGNGRRGLPERYKDLTKRQMDVWRLAAEGKTNAEAGVILGIAGSTAAKHMEGVLARLCVENRTTAATLYPAEMDGLSST